MKFEQISENDFREFAVKSAYKSFMQTPEIAEYRKTTGFTAYYLAVKEKEEVVAATMLLGKKSFLGKSIFLAPGGPLIDFENKRLVKYFFENLKNFAKAHGGYVLRVSPYYELVERGRDGELIEGGFDHRNAVKELTRLGFKQIKNADQPQYLFALDLKGLSPDELFASFKRNTRNHIRKAEKMGVKVHEINKDELDKFKQITESTSKRRDFVDHPIEYYKKMYDLFEPRGEAKFVLADVDIDGTNVPLSAAMFMLYGDEVVYLFSGSDEKYMRDYNAQYLIQWQMIKYSAEKKFKRYNFYGIQGLPNPESPDYGIYSFKKGFGGRVIELMGTYEAPIDNVYYLHKLLNNIKSKFIH